MTLKDPKSCPINAACLHKILNLDSSDENELFLPTQKRLSIFIWMNSKIARLKDHRVLSIIGNMLPFLFWTQTGLQNTDRKRNT